MTCRCRKVFLKKIESAHGDDSHSDSFIDNFHLSRFGSEEPNALLDSRVAFSSTETSTEIMYEKG